MRLVGSVGVAAFLAGCSYVGGPGHHPAPYGGGAAYGGPVDPCQVPHAQAPLPRGCHPSQVTIGLAPAGGFPQQPQFGAPQAATGGYGAYAGGNQHTQGLRGASGPRLRKPRFRGALDVGVEKSLRGDLLDYARAPDNPISQYNPYEFAEASRTLTDTELTYRSFTADSLNESRRPFLYSRSRRDRDGSYVFDPALDVLVPWDEFSQPTVSFDDAWAVPASFGASGEFILNDKATVFGRVGYTTAEGTNNDAASVEATLYDYTSVQAIDPDTGDLTPAADAVENLGYRPNTTIATFNYDFSDMNRLDLEAGGRLYFDPIGGRATGQSITPFVGASAGASRYNGVHYTVSQRQLSYGSAFDGASLAAEEDLNYFNVRQNAENTRVDLYNSQWVPSGRLSAGMEWQVTPGTALALETGIRVEGSREYANGNKGDTNVSVPVTLRGSFNF